MSRIIQVATGISLIIVAVGTMTYIHSHRFSLTGVVALVLVVGLIAWVYKYLSQPVESKQTDIPNSELAQRIVILEQRLTDIQDVMITIDEKLSRMERPAKPDQQVT